MELSGKLTVSLALYIIPQAKYTDTPPGVESLRLFTAVDVVILCCDFMLWFLLLFFQQLDDDRDAGSEEM